jgi:uncharacterized protein YdeI (BOF family)
MAQKKKDRQDNGPKEERQTIQWAKKRKTYKTMAQKKKEKQYNGPFFWPIVLSVFLLLFHCIVSLSSFGPLYCLSFFFWAIERRKTDNTMAQKKKERQCNGPKEERQTIQWAKRRKTDNTMAQKKKDRQDNGPKEERETIHWPKAHCIVCLSSFGPLHCLSFFFWAIVLSVFLLLGHCIVCLSSFGPLYCLSFFFWAKKKDRQYNGPKEERQTIQWHKRRKTDNTMAQKKKDRQYNGPKEERQTIQWPKRRKRDNTMAQKKKDDKE